MSLLIKSVVKNELRSFRGEAQLTGGSGNGTISANVDTSQQYGLEFREKEHQQVGFDLDV